MHTRERAFYRLFLVTCRDIYKLCKCFIKKTINKATANNIREVWVKEREEKRARKATDAQGVVTKIIQKTTDRIAKAKIVDVCFITIIYQAGDWFH
jgi:hypothetical protein